MDYWVVAFAAALVSSHALAALVTGLLGREETRVRIKLSEGDLRRDLETELSAIRDTLRVERARGDVLAELLEQEKIAGRTLGMELREARSTIADLQSQLIEATNRLAALTVEAATLRERMRTLEQR